MNTQITEDYVSFETAKLLKEKGFDEQCHSRWDYNPNKENTEVFIEYIANGIANNKELEQYNEPDSDWAVSAPTLQMAMKWLREVHKIYINILYDTQTFVKTDETTEDVDVYEVDIITKNGIIYIGNYNHYESACEAAIKYCLTNLI